MNATTTRFTRTLAAVLVAGGAVLAVAGPASASESASESVRTSGDPGDPGTSITVSGVDNGTLADASVSCIGGGFWEVTGTLDGAPVDMFVGFSQGDPGVGAFPLDTGLDAEHGLVTLTTAERNYVTDSGGENTGTFTVDPDGRSGSLDARTSTTDGKDVTVVQGTWSCA